MKNEVTPKVIRRKIDFTGIGLVIILVLMGSILSIINQYFFTLYNIFNILLSVTVIGISAVGMTVVIVSGGLDLSTEAVIGCTGVIIGLLNQQGLPLVISILVGLLLGPTVGFINGILIAKAKINAVIVTLATMYLVRGFGLLLTRATTVPIRRSDFGFIGRGHIFGGIPIAIIYLVFAYLIFYFILNNTPFGRNIYAVGGNPVASKLAGINVDRYRIIIYVISGFLGAISGLLFSSITGAGLPYGASGYILTIIAAVILGGTSLAGGIGRVQGTLLGVLIIGILGNGLVLLGLQTYWQMVVTGIVLIVAVAVDQIKLRGRI